MSIFFEFQEICIHLYMRRLNGKLDHSNQFATEMSDDHAIAYHEPFAVSCVINLLNIAERELCLLITYGD